VSFSAPVTDHAASDDAGTGTLGEEGDAFWRDHKGAGVNAIRTQTLIRAADLVVVRFGDKYRSGTRPSTPASPPPSASRSSPSTTPSSTML
jgi:YtoQ family protein